MTKELKKDKIVGDPSIEKDALDTYRKRRTGMREDQAAAMGEIGSLDKTLCDQHTLVKRGLSMFNALDKMSAEKRRDTLRTLDYLRDMVAAEWEAQGNLDLDGAAETTATIQ